MQQVAIRKEKLNYQVREAYKTLRTNVELSGENVKVIALTSCTPGEGKSTVSFYLAKSFAENGDRTLFIDADLRKSVLRRRHSKGILRLGLTNYLAGGAEAGEVITKTDVENFDIIFSGPFPPNPSELLGSERFENLIRIARANYDVVIIDTPPLGSVIDTVVASKFCDGVIMVVSAGEISYHFALDIKDQLDKANAKILGVVLNKVRFGGGSAYGKYYGKYYGRYGFDDESEKDKKKS